jgi:hypothetical protein
MANYKYRLIRKKVVESNEVTATSRDEALGYIYDGIYEDVADNVSYEVQWIDGKED